MLLDERAVQICVGAATAPIFFQTGGISVTPLSERKRRRETVSSYSRKFGKKFLSAESAPLKSGPWRILETLCLIVCHEVLVVNGLPNNSINFASLYNFVAESNETKELSLPIANCQGDVVIM